MIVDQRTNVRPISWRSVFDVCFTMFAVLLGLIILGLCVGLVRIGGTVGPGGYTDGKMHQEVEISVVDEIGYKFGGTNSGLFRPMKW
jgi:hypothetical protein